MGFFAVVGSSGREVFRVEEVMGQTTGIECEKPSPGQFAKFISRLHGRQRGAFKRAARLAGLSFDEYTRRLDSGLKRCSCCGDWKSRSDFGDDSTRWDGAEGFSGMPRREAHKFGQVGWNGNEPIVYRVGKKAAGRMLDGREWNEFPKVPA